MADEVYTIGEVIDLLRDEFPDVTVSKVRFLESQGLLSPARSESGYRQFGPADIDRLRYILRLQRDHFLPLKVIKSKLTLWERGEDPDADAPPPSTGLLERGEPEPRDEVLRRSGLPRRRLDELIAHGVLSEEDGLLEEGSAVIAAEARRLFDLGLEPRHLRAVRHAAEREADLVFQLVAPFLKMTNPEARRHAEQMVSDAGEALLAIHRMILTSELRRLIER